MARTKPSNKARARAEMLKKEVEIDPSVDPEMRKTLAQERGRRVGFKKSAEALNSLDPLSRKLVPPTPKKTGLLRRVGQKLGVAGPSEESFAEQRAKIQKKKDQNEGARYLRRQMGG